MLKKLGGESRLAVLMHGARCIARSMKRNVDAGRFVFPVSQAHLVVQVHTLNKFEKLLIIAPREMIEA